VDISFAKLGNTSQGLSALPVVAPQPLGSERFAPPAGGLATLLYGVRSEYVELRKTF